MGGLNFVPFSTETIDLMESVTKIWGKNESTMFMYRAAQTYALTEPAMVYKIIDA